MREHKQTEQDYERELDRRVNESIEFLILKDKVVEKYVQSPKELREITRLLTLSEMKGENDEYLRDILKPTAAVVFALGLRAERIFSEKTSKLYRLLMRQVDAGKQSMLETLDVLSAAYAICYRTLYYMYALGIQEQMEKESNEVREKVKKYEIEASKSDTVV